MATFQVRDYTVAIKQQEGRDAFPWVRIGLFGGGEVNVYYNDDFSKRANVSVRGDTPKVWTTCGSDVYSQHLDLLRNESPLAVIIGISPGTPLYATSSGYWSLVALLEPVGEGEVDESNVLFNPDAIPGWFVEFLARTYAPE